MCLKVLWIEKSSSIFREIVVSSAELGSTVRYMIHLRYVDAFRLTSAFYRRAPMNDARTSMRISKTGE